jgi:hypothetical protein
MMPTMAICSRSSRAWPVRRERLAAARGRGSAWAPGAGGVLAIGAGPMVAGSDGLGVGVAWLGSLFRECGAVSRRSESSAGDQRRAGRVVLGAMPLPRAVSAGAASLPSWWPPRCPSSR